MKQVVIVGGGFAGLAAAKALSGNRADVTLINRLENIHFNPLLPDIISAYRSHGWANQWGVLRHTVFGQ